MKTRYKRDTESFISISTAWALGIICFSIAQVTKYGTTIDFESIIFDSFIFTFIIWIVFLRIPLNRINSSSTVFNKFNFPLLTTLYALTIVALFKLFGFIGAEVYETFILTGSIGLIFGLLFIFISTRGLKNKLEKNVSFSIPIIALVIFFWMFPVIFPRTALKFMPQSIKTQIIKQTIKEFKVGDSFSDLKQQLPEMFGSNNDVYSPTDGEYKAVGGLGGLSIFGYFYYAIQVHCNKIILLEYSDKEDGYKDLPPIAGSIHSEPCP